MILSYFNDTLFYKVSEDVHKVFLKGIVLGFFTASVVGFSICGFEDVLLGVLMDDHIGVLKGFSRFMRFHSGTNDWFRVFLCFVEETLVDNLSGLPIFQHHPHIFFSV